MLFEKTYGIDLGGDTIKIYSLFKNKTYIQKNMIATKANVVIATGDEAYEMYEKNPGNIKVLSPMNSGLIANLELQEIVLYKMIKSFESFLSLRSDVYFSVPLDMTAVEKRSYYHVVNGNWLRNNRVFMVEAPYADAIAMGMSPETQKDCMIVNMGSQSTQFSIISAGKVIISRSVSIGGSQMDEAICSEIRKRYNLQIGSRTAKRLKFVMGRLIDQRKDARKVVGLDSISGLPREEVISSYVVNAGIMNCVNDIAAEMKSFLERIPPQTSYQIAKEGIHLTGGCTRIPFIDKYLASYTGYTFNLSDLYENSTLVGIEKIIKDKELRKWAHPVKQRKL